MPASTSSGATPSSSSTRCRTRTAARGSSRTNGAAAGRDARRRARSPAEHDEPWPGGRVEPLPVRHEPRLVRAVAARDPRPRARLPRLVPAGRRRPARDGRRLDVLLRAARRSVQPLHHAERSASGSTTFGRANAARFDERGSAYFIREVFDCVLSRLRRVVADASTGAVGMTYEQASARGLACAARGRHDVLTYRDGVRHHFTAGHHDGGDGGAQPRASSCATSSSSGAAAVREGEAGRCASTCCRPATTRRATRRLVELLAGQGIEVRVASAELHGGRPSVPGRVPSSCRSRSRPAASSATCSTRTSRWTRRSSRSRIAGGRSGCRTRSTT